MSCSSKRKRLVGSCISTLVSRTNSLQSDEFLRLARLVIPGLSRAVPRGRGAWGDTEELSLPGTKWRIDVARHCSQGGRDCRAALALTTSAWFRVSSECLRGGKDFGCMAGYLHTAPGARDVALRIDQKGGAFDAAHLFAVHVLHLDDLESLTCGFVGIGNEIEGQFQFGLEILVRFHAVA